MKSIPISPREEISPTQRALAIALLIWWLVSTIGAVTTGRQYPFLFGVAGGTFLVVVFVLLQWLRTRRFSLMWDGGDVELRVGTRIFFGGSVESMHAVHRTIRGYRLYPTVGRRFYSVRSAEVPPELQALLDKKHGEQAGTGQPATRPVFESEGSDKPQPAAEGRSR